MHEERGPRRGYVPEMGAHKGPWVCVGYRCGTALYIRSPGSFVGAVTTPEGPESHPPNASISPLLVNWCGLTSRAAPVQALRHAGLVRGGPPLIGDCPPPLYQPTTAPGQQPGYVTSPERDDTSVPRRCRACARCRQRVPCTGRTTSGSRRSSRAGRGGGTSPECGSR